MCEEDGKEAANESREKDAEKRTLMVLEQTAKRLKGRVFFGRLHVQKESEMVNKIFSTFFHFHRKLETPSIWIKNNSDSHFFQYKGKMETRALASLALEYYRPAAIRWKDAAERQMHALHIPRKASKLVIDYCAFRWCRGIQSLPRRIWSGGGQLRSSPLPLFSNSKEEEEKRQTVRYFLGIVNVFETSTSVKVPSYFMSQPRGRRMSISAAAHTYKQAFADAVISKLR
mmetsp:Transcript_32920/g.45945  ORF Transcript_32920/g.45945 Transcript_32920/m.45945 type:complete len:229 (+) Transcript_32920:1186-1872(+)